uniref:Uncharacterized protein n=1 Tax=Panagrolaimus davidi TaxID=227884 RepID=A0A914QTV6_9BILA
MLSVYKKYDIQFLMISNFTVDTTFTNESATSYCVSEEICTSDFSTPFEIQIKNTTINIIALFPSRSYKLFDISVDDESFYEEDGHLFDLSNKKCLIKFNNETNEETSVRYCCTNFKPAPIAPTNSPKCKKFQSRTSILDMENNFKVIGTSTMTFKLNENDVTGSGTVIGSNEHDYIATYYIGDSICEGHAESSNITCSNPLTLPNGDSLTLIRVLFMEEDNIFNKYDYSFDGMVGRILIRNGQTLMEEGKSFTTTNNCFYINYKSDANPTTQTPYRQSFPFSPDVNTHLRKNPKTGNGLEKLYQSRKYF